MKIWATFAKDGVETTEEIEAVSTPSVVKLDRDEIEHGMEAVRIDVVDKHGQIGRFWVDLRISQKGAPVCVVTTKAPDGKELTKTQAGFWKNLKG